MKVSEIIKLLSITAHKNKQWEQLLTLWGHYSNWLIHAFIFQGMISRRAVVFNLITRQWSLAEHVAQQHIMSGTLSVRGSSGIMILHRTRQT